MAVQVALKEEAALMFDGGSNDDPFLSLESTTCHISMRNVHMDE